MSITLSISWDFFAQAIKKKMFPQFSWRLQNSFKTWNMTGTQKLYCEICHFPTIGKSKPKQWHHYINIAWVFKGYRDISFNFYLVLHMHPEKITPHIATWCQWSPELDAASLSNALWIFFNKILILKVYADHMRWNSLKWVCLSYLFRFCKPSKLLLHWIHLLFLASWSNDS